MINLGQDINNIYNIIKHSNLSLKNDDSVEVKELKTKLIEVKNMIIELKSK